MQRARRAAPLHGREHRPQLAGGEVLQFAKAGVEFGGGEAAPAVEGAQKIRGRVVALAGIALDAAGNQVAVGIAAEARARDDVVDALHVAGSAAEAVKAGAAFAIVNGLAERPSTEEIGGLERRGRRVTRSGGGAILAILTGAERANLPGQAHLDEVAGFAAFEEAESSQLVEAADGLAHGSVGKPELGGYGHDRKVQAGLADDEGMA